MASLRKFLITLFFLFSSLCVINTFADSPLDSPPPPPGGGHGGGGNPQGAPIDNGTSVLLVLGASYGLWKLYQLRKQDDAGTLPDKLT